MVIYHFVCFFLYDIDILSILWYSSNNARCFHRKSVLEARLMSSHGGRLYRRRKERHPQMDILPLARFVHVCYHLTVG